MNLHQISMSDIEEKQPVKQLLNMHSMIDYLIAIETSQLGVNHEIEKQYLSPIWRGFNLLHLFISLSHRLQILSLQGI